ncbi:nitrilase-related carbon-nitrogen hydrolase [Streptomyces sp. DSM 42041]|uniref:Nitrilase-related carbon-nitrogen hydrolase n=1 Tax=Streptomyces hazeniae TaxID=3075538 RepID=A0ABU2NP36_9ACTN|nr:nitrilase-related carbon-nitrogen hydrolase [Streptomyces sp. DSM 42041]MDT0377777.1 nitrilase-related carbon-nitrogen hydrolase [Streptomyces sp. DSM 42041]
MTSPHPPQALHAAVAQFAASTDVRANLRRVRQLAAAAAAERAELVVFPEAAMYAWDVPAAEIADAARLHYEPFVDGLAAVAEDTGVTLVAGAFAPVDGDRDAAPHNRLVVTGPGGVPQARYDKVHLFDAFSWQESDKVTAARTAPDFAELCTVPVGGFTVGLLNCYDLRFPEMARALVDRGADVLAVSSAWVAGPHKEMHWETLLRARAIENTCYVLASDQPPPRSAGLSQILDPLGLTAAACLGTEGVAVHRLDVAHLREVRTAIPSLKHRRYQVAPQVTPLSKEPAGAGPSLPVTTGEAR